MLSPEARQIHADFAAVEKRSLPARAEHVYPLDFKAGPWLLANQGSIAPRSKAAILADLGRAAFLADEMGDGLADMPSPAEGISRAITPFQSSFGAGRSQPLRWQNGLASPRAI